MELINLDDMSLEKAEDLLLNNSEEDLFEKADHNIGDLHPNGKWVWKEYKPGKFDWRVIPKKKLSTSSNNSTSQNNNALHTHGKPMNLQQLANWVTKTSEDNLLKLVGPKTRDVQARKLAFEELKSRKVDMSKVDISGSLEALMKLTSKQSSTSDSSTDTGDTDDIINEDGISEKWYLNKNDKRVTKLFNLKTKGGRIAYDKFVYQKKKAEPDYIQPTEVIEDLNEQYMEFLRNKEQRFMISAGGAGIGKSYGFKKMAEILNKKPFTAENEPGDDDYDYIEAPDTNSGKQLLTVLKAHNGKIILFDDNDKVLRRADCSPVMKKATATSGIRIVDDPDDITKNFEFTGRIIVMTNKDMIDITSDEDSKAIASRAMMLSEINLTVEENIQLLKGRYQDFNFRQAPRLENAADDKKERDEIFNLIETNKNNIDPAFFSTRTFQEILINKRKVDFANIQRQNPVFQKLIGKKQKNWKDKAVSIITKGNNNEFENNIEETEILEKAKNVSPIKIEDVLEKAENMSLEKAEDILLNNIENLKF